MRKLIPVILASVVIVGSAQTALGVGPKKSDTCPGQLVEALAEDSPGTDVNGDGVICLDLTPKKGADPYSDNHAAHVKK
jgi:hypothetical protein